MVAQKLLRVNLSDLAAKGASPFGYLLTTALPVIARRETWLEEFAAGLAADRAGIRHTFCSAATAAVIPAWRLLSATLIGQGRCSVLGKAIRRSGGSGGRYGLCLRHHRRQRALASPIRKGEAGQGLDTASRDQHLIDRYRLPRPRAALGPKLLGLAHAMLDISTGWWPISAIFAPPLRLFGAVIRQSRIFPLSPAGRAALASNPDSINAVTGGGDDYELLFAAPAVAAGDIAQAARRAGVAVMAIGTIVKGEGVTLLDAAGRPMKAERSGYAHF